MKLHHGSAHLVNRATIGHGIVRVGCDRLHHLTSSFSLDTQHFGKDVCRIITPISAFGHGFSLKFSRIIAFAIAQSGAIGRQCVYLLR